MRLTAVIRSDARQSQYAQLSYGISPLAVFYKKGKPCAWHTAMVSGKENKKNIYDTYRPRTCSTDRPNSRQSSDIQSRSRKTTRKKVLVLPTVAAAAAGDVEPPRCRFLPLIPVHYSAAEEFPPSGRNLSAEEGPDLPATNSAIDTCSRAEWAPIWATVASCRRRSDFSARCQALLNNGMGMKHLLTYLLWWGKWFWLFPGCSTLTGDCGFNWKC